jgi:integrase/recombinase XerD
MKAIRIYAPYIEQYLAFKRSLGFKMKTEASVLAQFDRLITDTDQSIGITKLMSDAWCEKRPNETFSNRYARVIHLCQFAKFLSGIGIPSYIPEIPKFHSSFTPYIFSKEQMESFFLASDHYVPYQINYNSAYLMMPSLFRLLYATGLRLGEALSLKEKDINLNEKYLIVRQSKNRMERIVPISDSLTDVCLEYKNRKKTFIKKQIASDLFFVKRDQSACTQSSAYEAFRQILWRIGIAHQGRGLGPRLHDFRHTFACHALQAMAESGLDLYHSLPILSTYLGHQTLEATNKYVRLTSELYPDLLKTVNDTCDYIFPRLKNIDNETH